MLLADILKVNYFARSQFSAELCAEIAIKTYKIKEKKTLCIVEKI